jgi:uroporphyrinogen III methyltransferase/synthase
LRADLVPPRFTSAALTPAILEQWNDGVGAKALLPRADIAHGDLLDDLRKGGIEPVAVTAYRTLPADKEVGRLKAEIEAGHIDAVTFASSSAARHFIQGLTADFLSRSRGTLRFVSIGPVTSETLSDLGFPPDVEAEEHTIPGLTRALLTGIRS